MNDAARQAALEGAFRQLKSTNEAYKNLIPGIARELMIMSPVKEREKDAAKKSVANLKSASGRLVQVLEQLPPEVTDALSFEPRALARLLAGVRVLNSAADNLKVDGKRKPSKTQAFEIACRAGVHYFALTGRKPARATHDGTAGGAFIKLLKDVYKILDVAASAENQTRELEGKWDEIAAQFTKIA